MSSPSQEIGLPVHESYPPPDRVREGALVTSREQYEELYKRSITDREGFWSDMANEFILRLPVKHEIRIQPPLYALVV